MVEGAQPDLASAMYPALSREAQQQTAERERRRQELLTNLRELNAQVAAGERDQKNKSET